MTALPVQADLFATTEPDDPQPRTPIAAAIDRRKSKKAQIRDHFAENLGRRYSSAEMHARWGSAFRTRVSDINRDPFEGIRIMNEVTTSTGGEERSVYWGVRR